jgi:glycosyltransferase involved in cell wall biosynthesis
MVVDKYPVITAIVNSHNSPNTSLLLERAIRSVAAQQLTIPWEVVVVNDGPPDDGIGKMLEGWVEAGSEMGEDKLKVVEGTYKPNFKFFGTDEASGYQCYPKNVATYHAKGEFISYLDYDNEWTPTHLADLYEAHMEGVVWPDFTYGRRRYVVDEGADREVTLPDGAKVTLKEYDSEFVVWDEVALNRLAASPMYNFIDSSDFMITKGALWWMQAKHEMMWNERLRRFADWELMARGAHMVGWRGKGVDKVLSIYHWHGSNVQLTRPVNEGGIKREAV